MCERPWWNEGRSLSSRLGGRIRHFDVEPDLESAKGERDCIETARGVAVGRRRVVGLGDGVLERAVRAVVGWKRLLERHVFNERCALDGQESAKDGLRKEQAVGRWSFLVVNFHLLLTNMMTPQTLMSEQQMESLGPQMWMMFARAMRDACSIALVSLSSSMKVKETRFAPNDLDLDHFERRSPRTLRREPGWSPH